jgi:Cof subfamily protein (haloacid dehalogenase superfamily)
MLSSRISAIDIDGTLVDPQKNISARNAQAVAAYTAAGGTVVLSSGRMYSSILRYGIELGLPSHDIILSYNGAMAKTIGGELLFERPVPAQYGAEIIAYCRQHGLHLNFYYDDSLYVDRLDEWSELYGVRSGSTSIAVGDLTKLAEKPPTKLLIIDDKFTLDNLITHFQEKYHGLLYITKTDDEYLEFMAEGVDKGTSLQWVAEHLGVPQTQTAAFGDSYNDVPMIEWAGIGVAMSNGRREAIAAADVVADNNAWDGVGAILEEFVGNTRKRED